MRKEGKLVSKGTKRRKICSIKTGSGDSDEDYVLGDDEEFYGSEGSCSSSPGYASEESFDFGAVGIRCKESRKAVRSKDLTPIKGSLDRKEIRVRKAVKTTRFSDDEEEDYDFDDEDDEEFMPDGIDYADEDEEFLVKKKSGKAQKRLPRKRTTVKGRKRKRKSKMSKKPSVTRPMSSDDDFIVKNTVVKDKSKKKKGRARSKKFVVEWDSDSASASSLDLTCTVSDEEAELLREASNFCGNSTTRSRNSSLAKKSQDNEALNCRQRKPTGRKGKEKVGDLQNDSAKQVCGICFSEEGKGAFRGTLNCCSHYFCFACIVEWSKVESRCPLCKQRFMTISKPARSNIGIDLRNVVVQVPERDQVYQPSEEEVRGYLDPYENVVCMECQQGGDDNLMLLCDICDSSAHTYCVGLGQEVPEGNWYCKGCRTSDPGFSNTQVQDHVPNQGTNNSSLPTDIPTSRTNGGDFDSTPQYSVTVPDPSVSQSTGILPSPRYPFGEDVQTVSPSGVGASTLFGRRRLHRQIRNLLSNNRMNQTAEMVGRTDVISHSNVKDEVVNSEFEQVESATAQRLGTLSSSGFHSAAVEGWAQDANSCSVQDRNHISSRLNRLGRQVSQNPRISIPNGSTNGNLFTDSERTNSILGSEQLLRCSRRPLIGSDDDISPHTQ